MRLEKLRLVSGEEIELGAYTVIIGANDTGKSTFIKELFTTIASIVTQPPSAKKWIVSAAYSFPDIQRNAEKLRLSLSFNENQNKKQYFSSHARNLQGNPETQQTAAFSEQEVQGLVEPDEELWRRYSKYRHPFVSYASCESRLLINSPSGLQGMRQPAHDLLNLMYRRCDLFEDLRQAVSERFGYQFSLLTHEGNTLQLGTSETAPPNYAAVQNRVQAFHDVDAWKEEFFTQIQDAGHGLRSMVRILETLLDPMPTVKLIDEPELHLYPAQKIWLGRKISEMALASANTQMVVVTHDSHILQGILEDRPHQINVLRFHKENGERTFFRWDPSQDNDLSPQSTRSQFLSGLFHEYCIGVEGDSDRLFYRDVVSHATQGVPSLCGLDVSYVPCGGTGGSVTLSALCKSVRMPAVTILDLDALFEHTTNVRKIVARRAGGVRELPALKRLSDAVDAEAKVQNSKWRQVVGYSDREGVDSKWRGRGSNDTMLDEALAELKTFGVFVVPKGSLESWASKLEPKGRFPEKAPDYIRDRPDLLSPLRQFLDEIGRYFSGSP